jgi:hypothetical protein
MVLRISNEEAELIAHMVQHEAEEEFGKESEISAHMIHKFVAGSLKKYNQDVSYMYDTHKDFS